MSDFVIVTDSAADLSKSYAEMNDIRIVPFYITFDGVKYYKENVDLTHDKFYSKISEGVIPKTSCPSINDYAEVFKQAVEGGKKVICFCLSSKLSGSYQSACNAAQEFNAETKNVYVIDSYLVSGAQGLLINEAVRMQNDSLDADEVFKICEELKMTGEVLFVIDDLTYLQKGGRIGKASALMGTLLNIKPVIMVKDGELIPVAKIRGRKKAAAEIKKLAAENMLKYGSYSCTILNFKQSGDIDGFENGLNMTMPAFCIGSTIGSHVGTSAAGIAYIKRYNK